jgi:ribose-phosphate pyrophosphokinase
VSGSASVPLSRELSKALSADLVVAEVSSFADGEIYVRIPERLDGEDVVLVQTTYPNDKLLELFLLQDALSDAGLSRLTVVIPYFAYGRQDRRFKEGEAISSRAVARRVQIDANRVLTVDVHDKRVMGYFDVPAVDLTGIPALARYFSHGGVDMVLAPDENAARHARSIGDLMKVPWDHLKKERIDSWTVETEEKPLDVKGLKVAIVDDVISTGGTMASAARIVKKQGASSVVAGCVHGLFVGGAEDRLKVFDDVVATDTVFSQYSRVSVAPEVAEAILSE